MNVDVPADDDGHGDDDEQENNEKHIDLYFCSFVIFKRKFKNGI